MQTLQAKIFVFLTASLLTIVSYASSSDVQISISQADSLFSNKKYTESYLIYDSIFFEKKYYSPQMLMKMTFVKEGIGEYEKALYFLNYLYFWHPDQRIADKMNSLAEKNNLEGYESNDLDLAFQLFTNHKANISYGVIGFLSLLFIITLFIHLKHNNLSYPLIALILLFSGGLFYINNFNPFDQKAIIKQNNALVMSDASSASTLLNAQKKGSRISVLAEKDEWYLIELEYTTGYIKKNQLDIIEAF